jgi:hypothetical protein
VEKQRVRFFGFLHGSEHFGKLDRQSAADIQILLFKRLMIELSQCREHLPRGILGPTHAPTR